MMHEVGDPDGMEPHGLSMGWDGLGCGWGGPGCRNAEINGRHEDLGWQGGGGPQHHNWNQPEPMWKRPNGGEEGLPPSKRQHLNEQSSHDGLADEVDDGW